jgi:pimeloyl-CoA dehydrogenase small subunit
MDFRLSEEQRLLSDSVRRLLTDHYTFESRKKHSAHAPGWSPEMWRAYAELGLLSLPFAESDGGFGGGAVEMMIVMEEMGRALTLEPYLATVVLGGGLIREGGDAAQRKRLLPQIGRGDLQLAFGHTERASHANLCDVSTSARLEGRDWIIDGTKTMVLHGDCADSLLVTARVHGNRSDRDGLGLFLVDTAAKGVKRESFATVDGRRAANVTMAGVRIGSDAAIGEPGNALAVVERVVDQAIAALAAEAVGAMAAAHEATVDYLKTRVQFGGPIGRFQVLQHRAVDMMIALEQARSMALFGAMMMDSTDAAERSRSMAAVMVQTGRSSRLVAQQATQLHGGIGLTMEYMLGHYFLRLATIERLFGDADYHLERLAGAGGLFAAEA